MTFWELFGVTVSSAGLFASILGAFLTYAARKNGEATRDLIRAMEERMSRHIGELLDRMDRRAEEQHRETLQLVERMDQRADERHREAIQAIGALRAAG